MFYMWRGNIVLIDSFSDIILLDFSVLNILKNIVLGHSILARVFTFKLPWLQHLYLMWRWKGVPTLASGGT